MEKDKLLAQLIERKKEFNIKRLSLEKEYKRYETLYLAYGLFEKCLNTPDKIPLSRINQEIASRKEWLEEDDKILLREVYGVLKNELDIIIGDVLGG